MVSSECRCTHGGNQLPCRTRHVPQHNPATGAPTKKLALHNQWPQAVAAEMEAVGHVAKDGKRAPPSPSSACASDWNRQHNPGIT